MKETCTLTVSAPAMSILTRTDAESAAPFTMMAVSHLGKGVVYANVDPWIDNEYTDGRKLPLHEDNFAAGQEPATGWSRRPSRGRPIQAVRAL